MDRSMKVMFGMMTIAICLLAFTMMGNQSQQAYAGEYVGGGDRGTEPTIVSFRVTPIGANLRWGQSTISFANSPTALILLTRMWSDGTIEVNMVGSETLNNFPDQQKSSYGVLQSEFVDASLMFEGWVTVTDSVAGYACVGDTDGNRSVDITDMLAVFDNWGECEQDPPLGLPDDDDLM